MTNMMKKYGRFLAVALAAVLLVSIVAVGIAGFGINPARVGAEAAGSEERSTAAEISNITGVDIETILKIRNEGKSWNEVLEELKNVNIGGNKRNDRENILLKSAVGEDYIRELKNEGFTLEEIEQAKLLMERVIFQLQEITAKIDPMAGGPEVKTTESNGEDDVQKYRDLASVFDANTCMYLLIKLKKEFGSMEKVMDEYLYSLQAGIDLTLYTADKEVYLEQREKESSGMDPQDIITMASIEEKMLKSIRRHTENNVSNTDDPLYNTGNAETGIIENHVPEVPKPQMDDVKPQNPADEIIKEIEVLDPMKE